MPAYNNPGSGGGEDLYSDGAAAAAPAAEKPEESEDSGETALLPKSICPGMNPGEEMVLKIVKVHDDQYEVAYAPEPEKEEKEETPAKAPMPGAGSEMASMMED